MARPRSRRLPWGSSASFAEAFRVLEANLDSAIRALDLPAVIVTSSQAGEGKTVTVTQLATALAGRGSRVVLIDFDLRNPGLHHRLGGHNDRGVADVLRGTDTLDACLQFAPVPDGGGAETPRILAYLSAGSTPDGPGELLGSSRAVRLVERLTHQADLVLIDSAPVLPVADTLSAARAAGGAILVVDPHRTNADAVGRARDLLLRNRTPVLGMVLNQVRASDGSATTLHGYGTTANPEG